MKNVSRCVRYYATKSNTAVKVPSTLPNPRQKYPELSNLSPIPAKAAKHVSLNRTEPASVSPMVFKTPGSGGILDPNYRLISGKNAYRDCPSAANTLFTAKIVPHELLSHIEAEKMPPFVGSPLPPAFTRFGKEGEKIRYRSKMDKANVVYTSFLINASKAKVHNHAVIRRKTVKRIREALALIVIRGARASDDGTSIVLDPENGGEDRWLVKGWSYVLFPSLEAYRAPWPSLLTTLRETLTKLKQGTERISYGSTKRQILSVQDKKMNGKGKVVPSTSRLLPAASRVTMNLLAAAGLDELNPASLTTIAPSKMSSASTSAPSPPSPAKLSQTPRRLQNGSLPMGKHVSRARQGTLSKSNTPSTRSYSTKRASRSDGRYKRHDMRGEVVLGTHVDHILKHTKMMSEAEMFSYPEHLHQETDQLLDSLGVARIEAEFEHGLTLSTVEDDAHNCVGAYKDDDAEGWVVAGDRLPEDDLGVPHLLDPFNTSRFIQPNIPYHVGQGYERNMRGVWKDESTESIRAMFDEAVIERRKKRKALRSKWNQFDPEWLKVLRRREEIRLEHMYGWTLDRNENAQSKPWWAPDAGELGWSGRATIDAEEPRAANGTEGSDGESGRSIPEHVESQEAVAFDLPREARRLKWSDRAPSE